MKISGKNRLHRTSYGNGIYESEGTRPSKKEGSRKIREQVESNSIQGTLREDLGNDLYEYYVLECADCSDDELASEIRKDWSFDQLEVDYNTLWDLLEDRDVFEFCCNALDGDVPYGGWKDLVETAEEDFQAEDDMQAVLDWCESEYKTEYQNCLIWRILKERNKIARS